MPFKYEPDKKSLNEAGGNREAKLEAILRALLTKLAKDTGVTDLDYQEMLDEIKI